MGKGTRPASRHPISCATAGCAGVTNAKHTPSVRSKSKRIIIPPFHTGINNALIMLFAQVNRYVTRGVDLDA
jgi:hypothetical protein